MKKNNVTSTEKEIKYDKRGRRKYTFKEKVKNVVDLYDELIFCKLANKESSKCRYIEQETGFLGVDFLGSYDGENISFYYIVSRLPKEIYIDWKERL